MLGIDVALTQLGVAEATGKNDGTPAARYNRGDELPWCAAFCLYCNAHSDEEPAAPTALAFYQERAVQGFEDHAKHMGWWFPQGSDGVEANGVQRGDYVFFGDRGLSDAARTGRHMGIVEGLERGRGLLALHTVEGNWGNRVQQVVHDLTQPFERNRITGYARIPLRASSKS